MKKIKFSKEEIKELKEMNSKFENSIYGRQSLLFIKFVGAISLICCIMFLIYFIESLFEEVNELYGALWILGAGIALIAMMVMIHNSLMMSMFYNNNNKK